MPQRDEQRAKAGIRPRLTRLRRPRRGAPPARLLAVVPAVLALALCALAGPASARPAHRHPAHSRSPGTPRAHAHPAGAHRTRPRRTTRVTAHTALAGLLRRGAITQSTYENCNAIYTRATGSLRKLSGTRRSELAAVLANVEAMARGGQFVPSRLPVLFTTLQRNWEWWTAKPLLGSGQRVAFPGSRLVWEHYLGQGIEIQWLATFGEANGYWFSHDTTALEQVLDEATALATQRAGGIAWEYMFRFDGGSPPWTSALSQGTALQALARAWSSAREQRFLATAQQALGIFKTAPPEGVSAAASSSGNKAGGQAWYLQYTYAPGEHVINGFIQALVGLYDYAKLTGDPLGQQLFEAGDAQARAQLPRFDTGAWSMYDQHSESDLSYHDLLAEFLEHLCERTREGEPLGGGSTAARGVSAASGGATAGSASVTAGGTPDSGAGQGTEVGQIPGDEIYCTTASRFRQDLKTPPVVQLLTSVVKVRERAGVQLRLSKVSTVSMTIDLGHKTVWSNRATVEGGTPRLLWVTPSKPGVYEISLRATDLAGNEAQASGSIAVKAPPKRTAGGRLGKTHGKSLPRSGKAAGAAGAQSVRMPARLSQSGRISPPARRLPAL